MKPSRICGTENDVNPDPSNDGKTRYAITRLEIRNFFVVNLNFNLERDIGKKRRISPTAIRVDVERSAIIRQKWLIGRSRNGMRKDRYVLTSVAAINREIENTVGYRFATAEKLVRYLLFIATITNNPLDYFSICHRHIFIEI